MVKKNKIFVNGPNIAVRLEGNVNNIHKIIYLFGERHDDINMQTKCPKYDSVDFPNYFIKMMNKSDQNVKFDFFMEIFDQENDFYNNIEEHKKKDIYMYETRKFFSSKININNSKKNNLRLNIIDIRNKFSYYFVNKLSNIRNYVYNQAYITDYYVEYIKNILDENNKSIYLACGILLNNVKDEDNILYENNEIYKTIKYYSLKLLNEYKNNDVRDKLLNFTLNYIKQSIKYYKELSDKLENIVSIFNETIKKYYFKKYEDTYGLDMKTCYTFSIEIVNIIDELHGIEIKIYSKIMDLFFLRKFLDKDYITNVIAYTGYAHTWNYIYILVNYFNFKITHSSNQEISIDEIHTIVNNNDYKNIYDNKILPNEFIQCINMSSFPKYFI
jgi:hypothetical protein